MKRLFVHRSRCLRIGLSSAPLFVLVGCASFGGPGEPPTGPVWRAVAIDGGAVPRLPDNRAPTLRLDASERRASGFTGCNRMTGSYTLDGDAIAFGPIASTRMACPEPGAGIEVAYLEALASSTHWRRRGGGLELLDDDGRVRMRLEVTGRVDAPVER